MFKNKIGKKNIEYLNKYIKLNVLNSFLRVKIAVYVKSYRGNIALPFKPREECIVNGVVHPAGEDLLTSPSAHCGPQWGALNNKSCLVRAAMRLVPMLGSRQSSSPGSLLAVFMAWLYPRY